MTEDKKLLVLNLITLQVRFDTLKTLVQGRLTPVEDRTLLLVEDSLEQVLKVIRNSLKLAY